MNDKYMGTRLLAGLLALVLCAGNVFAQGQPQRQTPQPGDIPVPDKVFGWYENQRIFIQTEVINSHMLPDEYDTAGGGTYRFGERFGNRVGNLIPVRYRIYLVKPVGSQREIEVEFASLKDMPPRLTILNVENQDWYVASPEVLRKGEAPITIREFPNTRLEWGGKVYECSKMVEVTLVVQTFKDPRYRMNLWLEFTYAASALPGGGLDWKPMETPDFWVDLSKTADPGNDLSLGNTNMVPPARPAALAWSLIGGGSFIALSVIVFWSTRYLRRNFGGMRHLDDQERLWSVLAPILEARKVTVDGANEAYALTVVDIVRMLEGVNDFINATEENSVNVHAWTLEEFKGRTMELKDGARWLHIIEPLREVAGGVTKPLPADRYGRIVGMIREICPKP
jgi:hypothetical protein